MSSDAPPERTSGRVRREPGAIADVAPWGQAYIVPRPRRESDVVPSARRVILAGRRARLLSAVDDESASLDEAPHADASRPAGTTGRRW
jgi:hypothetical protein